VLGVTGTTLVGCPGGTSLRGDASDDVTASDVDEAVDVAEAVETVDDVADAVEALDRECLTGEPGPIGTWLARLEAASGSLLAWSIAVAADGDLGLAGLWAPSGGWTGDLWLARLDAGGSLVRQLRISGSFALPVDIAPRPGGGFVVGTGAPSPWAETWIVGLDEAGDVEWHRILPNGFVASRPTPDGGFIAFTGHNPAEAWITRLDDDGNVVWQRRTTEQTFYGAPLVLSDGGIAASLEQLDYMDPDGWPHHRVTVVRLAADGGSGWRTARTGAWEWRPDFDEGPRVVLLPLPEGGLLLVDRSSLAALDYAGGRTWGGQMSGDWGGVAGAVADDRSVAGAGWFGGTASWLGGVDLSGGIRWQRSVDLGGTSRSTFAVARAQDGGLVFLGTGLGGDPSWIVKFGPDGEFGGPCAALGCPHAALTSTSETLIVEATDPFEIAEQPVQHGSATSVPDSVVRVERVCPES
jgi:hypothetical protein